MEENSHTQSKKLKASREKIEDWRRLLTAMVKQIVKDEAHGNQIDKIEIIDESVLCPFCDGSTIVIYNCRFKPSNFYAHIRTDHKEICKNQADIALESVDDIDETSTRSATTSQQNSMASTSNTVPRSSPATSTGANNTTSITSSSKRKNLRHSVRSKNN